MRKVWDYRRLAVVERGQVGDPRVNQEMGTVRKKDMGREIGRDEERIKKRP